jgi:type I restriction enzyme M protein
MPTTAKTLMLVASDRLRLTADGRIIDFLDSNALRPNTPEEHVRQNYARKIHHEYGYSLDRMVFNAPIQIGSDTKFADIAIYHAAKDAARKDQGRLRLIVETKAPDQKSGQAQLKSYISASSAEGGVWINETDAPLYLHRVGNKLEEWPNIPHADEDWDAIGKHKKHQLRPPHDLVETFKRCHNALYKVGIDSDDLAMDMVRIILAKYRDELNEGDSCEFRCTPTELQSADGRKHVADRVRDLFSQVRDDNLTIFDEHERISAGDREIAIVVSELQDFRFLADDESDEIYDVVGAAYEVYVGSHLKGDRGQYFTQRLMVQLLVRMIDPGERDVILDPAMGSAGFLIAAMRHVTRNIMASDRAPAAKRKAIFAFRNRIFGIDKSPKLVKVARTNMVLASDGHSGLVRGDSLEPISRLPKTFQPKTSPPTIILTNPPFGATSEHKITADREPEILAQFELGHAWRRMDGEWAPTSALSGEGVPPEYLFVERCLKWVQPGGKVGIVVPRGVLDNDKALPVRLLMLREARVLAVVNCHDDTFKPYTDAKAALLVLEKKKTQAAKEDNYAIFMAISQAIGHNGVGEPIYKTDKTGEIVIENGQPIVEQDTGEIFKAWTAINKGQKSGSDYYFSIPRAKLTENLNLNPVRYLPRYSKSRQAALLLGEQEGWKSERLGQIATVYCGPRFKRPYAEKGVTFGPGILRYFTGNAITQTRGENIKYLDLNRAKPIQKKMINKLYLQRGQIVITDSGTVGRVVYITQYHDGAVGTNNLIRVEVVDEALRGYVYQFLLSPMGQHQLKANIYGAIVDHLEVDDVKDVIVPLPEDRATLEAIGLPVIRAMELQEAAYLHLDESWARLSEQVSEDVDEVEIARKRLREIEDRPDLIISGEALAKELEALL